MKVLLHDNQLCERGTTNSVLSYAKFVQDAGHVVTVAFRKNNPANVPKVIEEASRHFSLFGYEDPKELNEYTRDFDASYFQKSGNRDGLCSSSAVTVVHAVFQEFQPHGSAYFYISEWLANRVRRRVLEPRTVRDGAWAARALQRGVRGKATGTRNAFSFESFPYMCDMPSSEHNSRSELQIPDDAFVVLRYGGWNTFDVEWVPEILSRALEEFPQMYFLGVNTPSLVLHHRAIYLPAVYNPQDKANLLSSADVFLTARKSGESFGLANVEALQMGVPVLGFGGGWDQNHVMMLGPLGGLYLTGDELFEKLRGHIIGSIPSTSSSRLAIGNRYRPNVVGQELMKALRK